MASQPATDRVELYRLLADEKRLRMLALCAEEELTVGELAEVLNEGQPKISRHAHGLRTADLLVSRKEGTRTYLKASGQFTDKADPVLNDALQAGKKLAMRDGSYGRLHHILAAREEKSKAFFEEATSMPDESHQYKNALRSHLFSLAPMLQSNQLAIDVGAGDGAMLDVLAPLYGRVIAVEQSRAQLARIASRIEKGGYSHVRLHEGSFDDTSLIESSDSKGGADLVFASRILHHASRPTLALSHLARLVKKGGRLVVIDYFPHDDESMREQGDVWLGLEPEELVAACRELGLHCEDARPIPASYSLESEANLSLWTLMAHKF